MKKNVIVCSMSLMLMISVIGCGNSEKTYTQSEVNQMLEEATNTSENESSSKSTKEASSSLSESYDNDKTTKSTEDSEQEKIENNDLQYIDAGYSIGYKYSQESFTTTYGSGGYLIGTDMPAGTYVGFTTGGTAHCEVYSGVDKEEKLNDNGYYSNYMVIFQVEEGEFVELTQAFCVPLEELQEKGLENYGIFVVGETIQAGRYKLQAKDNEEGHVSVLKDFDSNTRSADLEFVNRFYVSVKEGDILIVGNAEFTMPTNDENDDTDSYLITDDWGEHYSEGCYRVGQDIDPGVYIIYSNYNNGASSLINIYENGFLDNNVNTEFISGAQVFKFEEGQYINFDENSTMLLFDAAYKLGPDKSHIYLVGTDIDAGNVKLVHKNEDENDNAVVITEHDLNNNEYEGFDIFETQTYFNFVKGDYELLFDCEPA